MTIAAWDANITTVSSSSRVNPSPDSLVGKVDVADALASMEHRRCQKGQEWAHLHWKAEIREAQRLHVTQKVCDPQRSPNAAEVLEEPCSLRQLPQLLGLLRGHP